MVKMVVRRLALFVVCWAAVADAQAAVWSLSQAGSFKYSYVAPNFEAGQGFDVKTGDRVTFRMSTFVPAEGHHARVVAKCEEDENLIDKTVGRLFGKKKKEKTFDLSEKNKKALQYSRIDVDLFFVSKEPAFDIKLPITVAPGEDLTFVAPADGTIKGSATPIPFASQRKQRDDQLPGICGSGFNATSGPSIGKDTTVDGLVIPYVVCRSGVSAVGSPECALK